MTPSQQFELLNQAPNLNIETRILRLKTLKSVIKKNTNNIINALNQDYSRRSESETRIAEIMICLAEINHTLAHIKQWVKPKIKSAGIKFMFSKNAIIPQPLGVVGIISPWNYPFNLAIAPLIAAIAAGNKVMIKPSEITPCTSALIADIISQVFEKTEVAVSIGELEVAKEFSSLPFKHLLFTGSTTVGKIIMQAAACNLTPVTLELGGKSPVVIDEKYNLKAAAKSIVAGKFYNAGQTCIAPDYILINEKLHDILILAIKNEIDRSLKNPLKNKDYTAIINTHHFERLKKLANASEGFCIWPQGSEKDDTLNIFPPLLLNNPKQDSEIMQNEIFGPILPIISVKSTQNALDFINSRSNPLTLYIFSNQSSFINNIISNTLSGSVAVNETLVQFAQDGIAFGGVGESGMGSYHGENGFTSFSHNKSVYYQSKLNFNSMIRAPYSGFKEKIVRLLSAI
ncbi:MAG: aldehyde dehydrogenase family protein [Marinicellaceae bacterium]